jgi:3-oxoacyl-[acyl-carrier-protein] synthase II
MTERVAVTGLGLVTPIGIGRREVWRNLLAGECGIGPVRSFDTSAYSVHRGAEVHDFRPEEHLRNLEPSEVGRASQFAIAAAWLALDDADLDPGTLDPPRAVVAMCTTSGEPREVERYNDSMIAEQPERVGPEFMERYPCHVIPEMVAAEVGFGGINIMVPTACAAGNYAIAHAFDTLRQGRADVMLAGGADCFSRITYAGFARLGAIAPEWCRPFDKNRQGMVPGEGSAVLVLEPLSRARDRGARVYAEIAGYGLSCDAHHMTHPQGDGAARAMRQALSLAGIEPAEVDYVSAHGTGTPTNDRVESAAIHRIFGERAASLPVSSIKSMLGHTMGAASAIEAAACALAITSDRVPPTIHFEEADPECEVDCVPNRYREHPVTVAMSNAYAFGGNNASLILKECV